MIKLMTRQAASPVIAMTVTFRGIPLPIGSSGHGAHEKRLDPPSSPPRRRDFLGLKHLPPSPGWAPVLWISGAGASRRHGHAFHQTSTSQSMGKVVHCQECAKAYRNLEDLEDLRDNDSICLVCNAPVEVADWDRILASYEEDEEDMDDIEEDEGEIDEEGDWEPDEEADFGQDLDDEEGLGDDDEESDDDKESDDDEEPEDDEKSEGDEKSEDDQAKD